MNFGFGDAHERYLTHAAKVKQVEQEAWRRDLATASEANRVRTSAIVSWLGRLRHLRLPWTRLPRAESHG